MIIRTQNKQNIFNINAISGLGFSEYDSYQVYALCNGCEYLLGEYSTKYKALKVLDMIQSKYLEPIYIADIGGGEFARYERKIFQMPDDNDESLI